MRPLELQREFEELIQWLRQLDQALADGAASGHIRPTNAGIKVVFHSASPVRDEVYDSLRTTRWSLQAWPDVGQWSDQFMVNIFTKEYVRLESGTAYHLTTTENWDGIRSAGLLIGRAAGKHTTGWAESKHYIHVYETDEQRRFWCESLLPEARRLEFPIYIEQAGLPVYHDERSRGWGFILDATTIPPEFVGKPTEL